VTDAANEGTHFILYAGDLARVDLAGAQLSQRKRALIFVRALMKEANGKRIGDASSR
jgi:hypothetical protein